MEKNGMLTDKSQSDYSFTKRAAYYDADGPTVADEDNKSQLKKPKRIPTSKEVKTEEKE